MHRGGHSTSIEAVCDTVSPRIRNANDLAMCFSQTPLPVDELTRRGLTSCSFLSISAGPPRINSLLNTNPFQRLSVSRYALMLSDPPVFFFFVSFSSSSSFLCILSRRELGHWLIKGAVRVPVSLYVDSSNSFQTPLGWCLTCITITLSKFCTMQINDL